MSNFDLYILKKYLFIPLLVLCIPILGGPTLQCMAPRPSPLAKLIKARIMVNPLAYSLYGVNSSSSANKHGYFDRRHCSEFIKERVAHFAKTT